MKTIKDVVEELGITRRTLQEYDNIGLLSPSNKAEIEAGKLVQWKYDEAAIADLKLITLFVEAGYKRKDIMGFINDTKKLKKEYKVLEKKLEDKKNRIDWLLSEVKVSRVYMELPDSIISAIQPRAAELVKQKGIDLQSYIKEINEQVDLSDPEVRDYFKAQTVFVGLAVLDEPFDSANVQLYICRMLYFFTKILIKYTDDIEEYTDEELRKEFNESIDNKEDRSAMIDGLYRLWEEELSHIDEYYGEGREQYMRDALEYFREHGKSWKTKQGD